MAAVIAVQNLRKIVPATGAQAGSELVILDDVNLTIQAGDSVAITGSSGSGKSTLLALLAGLDIPSAGKIELFGDSIESLDEDQRAAVRLGKVGFVFQSFHLLDYLTAAENVMLPLELGNATAKARSMALDALNQVGLAARAEQWVSKLSGGEQQRVALARAFVTKPQLLFADEPTGNLDRATGHEVAELLFRLQRDYQTTLVLVTHDESLAAQCQHWYKLVEGKLQTGRVSP
ncbi:ABC transporter ATP-binding protein [Thiolinea disciformis]|uniref:ABC transporter ATP-binding protein n=1 Tax=Thiolinea disciformis TaxID=125614 RepID=UPI00037AFB73|nr:ATP-binding cassette domain-containing protein [Thiolinea disciformis]